MIAHEAYPAIADADTAPSDELRQFLKRLDLWDVEDNPDAPVFDPDSVYWRVNREAVLFIGGMRALLLQLAHPSVAQGVADHSQYQTDALGRAHRTFEAVHAMTFGTRAEARRMAARVYAIHTRVRGNLDQPDVSGATTYRATEPDLLIWVFATLIEGALRSYQLIFGPLSEAEQAAYYAESKRGVALFGIKPEWLPPDVAAFQQWFAEMVDSDVITVSPAAVACADGLLGGTTLMKLFAPLNRALAAGMLPPGLRQAYGLSWNRRTRWSFAVIVRLARLVCRVVPARHRSVPAARRSEARMAAQAIHQGDR